MEAAAVAAGVAWLVQSRSLKRCRSLLPLAGEGMPAVPVVSQLKISAARRGRKSPGISHITSAQANSLI
jgi:hypothetical protein